MQDGADGHIFERGPPKDQFSKVFELYKHNNELFNIYYVIFYEL
jgi:hypothetical protein